MDTFRNNGTIGALLDEYERAVLELQKVIGNVGTEKLLAIVDKETSDPDCRSIQTILTHVVRAGFGYVIEIRNSLGEEIDFVEGKTLLTIPDYQEALRLMFQYNEKLFADYPDLKMEENDPQKKIKVRWGQLYDVEQLFEHAIIHVLRHRRQIERFLIRLR
ncbi:MAG: hypothetical protein ACI8P3_001742 [Saprospiraceae bacterium]|jgi:hypothetical protein